MISAEILLFFAAPLLCGVSYLGVRLALAYSLRRQILDIPNERSSHTIPTPRGGGIGIVAALFVLWLILWLEAMITWHEALALFPTFIISVLGWWDDRKPLSARFRLFVQMSLASSAIGILGLSPAFNNAVPIWILPIAVIAIVWLTNLYNFMDGIDGIAGVQLASLGLVIAILSATNGDYAGSFFGLGSLGAAIGFLFLNWTPARIFMGDVGSAAIGFWLASWAAAQFMHGKLSLAIWFIVHAAFIGDATWTLVVRLYHGQKPAQAHRLHAYQKLTQRGWPHARVALCYGGYNLLWLLPLAAMTKIGFLSNGLSILFAYMPVFWVCLKTKAGRPVS